MPGTPYDIVVPFHLANGTAGSAACRIFPLPDGRVAVACMDENEDADVAVNMGHPSLFRTVCQHCRLDSNQVVWLEYSPKLTTTKIAGPVGGWELVTFDPPGSGEHPDWNPMSDDDWRSLGIEPPTAK